MTLCRSGCDDNLVAAKRSKKSCTACMQSIGSRLAERHHSVPAALEVVGAWTASGRSTFRAGQSAGAIPTVPWFGVDRAWLSCQRAGAASLSRLPVTNPLSHLQRLVWSLAFTFQPRPSPSRCTRALYINPIALLHPLSSPPASSTASSTAS